MYTFFKEYLNLLSDLHADISRAIEGLPQEALDWVPAPGMNSINVLVTHLLGAERYWMGDMAGCDPSGRDREAEFRTKGLDTTALQKRLIDAMAYAKYTLEKLSLAELERVCVSPRDGRKYTVAWSLLHALEHTALHLGHIQLTRQLWEQR